MRADDVMTRPAAPPARTTAYGPATDQVYDVRLPRAEVSGATVLVVHGGFWRPEYDRAHAASQAEAFAAAGHHVAVIEYRRPGMPGGGWPGTPQDVAAAIAAVRADPTLPDRVVLVGHSAGGHLVTWSASQPWSHGLAGAVSLAGVVALRAAYEQGIGDGAVEAFVGGSPDEVPDAYAAADPSALLPAVPVVLVHGVDDTTVPPSQSRAYLETMAAATGHAAVELVEVAACDHFGLIDPQHPGFARVLDAVAALAS